MQIVARQVAWQCFGFRPSPCQLCAWAELATVVGADGAGRMRSSRAEAGAYYYPRGCEPRFSIRRRASAPVPPARLLGAPSAPGRIRDMRRALQHRHPMTRYLKPEDQRISRAARGQSSLTPLRSARPCSDIFALCPAEPRQAACVAGSGSYGSGEAAGRKPAQLTLGPPPGCLDSLSSSSSIANGLLFELLRLGRGHCSSRWRR